MSGFRFDVELHGPGLLITNTVELDGIPVIGHRVRVRLKRDTGPVDADLPITGITWFHAPSALSKSGLLVLSA